jgi:hypothetical protein
MVRSAIRVYQVIEVGLDVLLVGWVGMRLVVSEFIGIGHCWPTDLRSGMKRVCVS